MSSERALQRGDQGAVKGLWMSCEKGVNELWTSRELARRPVQVEDHAQPKLLRPAHRVVEVGEAPPRDVRRGVDRWRDDPSS